MSAPRLGAGLLAVGMLGSACGGARSTPPAAPAPAVDPIAAPDRTTVHVTPPKDPLLPPQFARLAGLLPLRSTGVESFLGDHPSYDGRGVLIAILDSGIDAGVAGLRTTSTGEPKLLDLRDFSGEGLVSLRRVDANGDHIPIGDRHVQGVGRVRRLARPPFYVGVLSERPLGAPPAADLNGDGDADDTFPLLVARASDGWFVTIDLDGDGSFANERTAHDFSVAGETLSAGPLTIAVNLRESDGAPLLDLFFDNSGHGTHVAGIAGGSDLFDLAGFNGVAPGAQLLGLKISNNARGGISVTGSMQRALRYAAEYAAQRNRPLVVNLSFGIGNRHEGTATIDSIVDAFALAYPDVPIVISAGNDGPGLSTTDVPGSAEFAITACALFPGAFARPPEPGVRPADDVLGWWSGRGGEVAKPDLCAPGVAFSSVPPWNSGSEVSGGTSMAAPHVSGIIALLLSGLHQTGLRARAVDVRRALVTTAERPAGATLLDAGTGVPDVDAAFRWLRASHRAGRFSIRALPDGGNRSRATAAFRPDGLETAGDTVQRFRIAPIGGQPFARVLLRSDAPWLRGPEAVEFHGEPVTVTLTYDGEALTAPGAHVATVWAIPATDTLAGAAFGLTNTVVTPVPRRATFTERRYLEPGRADRFFFTVQPSDPGLDVAFDVGDPENEATLYVFEPGGQPYREHSSLAAGGDAPPRVTLSVRGDDLVVGAWEVVVVAPPLHSVVYRLTVRRPPVSASDFGAERTTVVNHTARPLETSVAVTLAGATRTEHLRAPAGRPALLHTTVPDWAGAVVLDFALGDSLWGRLTDFGVTVFDTTGRLLSEAPLNYPSGRHRMATDSLDADAIVIEFFPAFAREEDARAWSGEVHLAFLARDPIRIAGGDFLVPPDGRTAVPLDPPGVLFAIPDGFAPLLEISTAADGITATRWATTSRMPGVSP